MGSTTSSAGKGGRGSRVGPSMLPTILGPEPPLSPEFGDRQAWDLKRAVGFLVKVVGQVNAIPGSLVYKTWERTPVVTRDFPPKPIRIKARDPQDGGFLLVYLEPASALNWVRSSFLMRVNGKRAPT